MVNDYIEDFFGDVWFGDELANDVDWRDFPDEEDPDDELLAETPKDVVGILGFDPRELEEKSVKGLQTFIKGGPGSGSWNAPGDPREPGEKQRSIGAARDFIFDFAKQQTGNQEMAAYVTSDNRVIAVKGSDATVGFTFEQMREMKHVVHNHPGSSSFSCDDVATLIGNENLDSMDAIGNDGTLYTLAKGPDFAPDLLAETSPDPRAKHLQKTCGSWNELKNLSAIEKFQPMVDSGTDPNVAWKEQTHEIMNRMTRSLGLIYKRTQGAYKKGMVGQITLADGGDYLVFDDRSIVINPYLKKKVWGLCHM